MLVKLRTIEPKWFPYKYSQFIARKLRFLFNVFIQGVGLFEDAHYLLQRDSNNIHDKPLYLFHTFFNWIINSYKKKLKYGNWREKNSNDWCSWLVDQKISFCPRCGNFKCPFQLFWNKINKNTLIQRPINWSFNERNFSFCNLL